MRTIIFFIISFLLLINVGKGQTDNDSIMILKVRAAFNFISKNPDSSFAIAEKAIAQAKHSNNKRLAANAYKTRGWSWLHKGSYDNAMPDLFQATALFRQLHDSLEEMYMYVNLGVAYSNRSQFANAAKYMFLADSMSQKIDDIHIKAEVKRQMGILYREQGQHEQAINYFRESMEMSRSIHDTIHIFNTATSLCLLYMSMSLPDSALALLDKYAPIMNGLRGLKYEKAMFEERYGDAYFALAHYDKALGSYNDAYKIFREINNKADVAYEAVNIGKTYTALKDYHNAENYLLISYHLNDSLKMVNYMHDAAQQLAKLYKTKGDWRKAYQWLETTSLLQDSLQLTDENEKTAQLQAQYEAEKKDKEISLLKKDKEINHVIVERQKTFQYGAIAVLILLLLIGLLAVNRYREVQKATRTIELEKMRNNIARDLHDDMGSALSSINIISKVVLENAEEKVKVNEHLRKIHENSGFMLENMSDIVWTINPINDTLEKVLFKMKEFAADILEPLNIQYNFRQDGNFKDVKMGLQVRKDIYLVFKEAINNAAKYSKCSKVDIYMSRNDKQIEMGVSDNGNGFNMESIKNGNGLKNMQERANQIHAGLDISSKEGKGTTVILKIKSHD